MKKAMPILMRVNIISSRNEETLFQQFVFLPGGHPHTHIKRPAPRHNFLPSLLGEGDKLSEIVYGEKRKKNSGQTRAAKAGQNYLVATQ